MENEEKKKYYSVNEFALLTGLNATTVRYHVRNGKYDAYQIGNSKTAKIFIAASEVGVTTEAKIMKKNPRSLRTFEFLKLSERKIIEEDDKNHVSKTETGYKIWKNRITVYNELKRFYKKHPGEMYNALQAQKDFEEARKISHEKKVMTKKERYPNDLYKSINQTLESMQMQIDILVEQIQEIKNGNNK